MKQNKKKKTSYVRRNVSWSNLPGKIIFKISKNLKTRDDILCFRRVCRKWRKRSLTPPQNLLFFNAPLPKTIQNSSAIFPFHSSERPLILRVSNIYLITPSRREWKNGPSGTVKPWMIMAEETNPGNIKVRHPLTAKRVKNIPPFLDMTQFRASELAQGYNFKSSKCVLKVLLCSSSASCLEVMVLYYSGVLGKLFLEVLESGAENNENDIDDEDEEEEVSYSWKRFRMRYKNVYWFLYLDDVARFRDMYCGVDRKGRLFVLDDESMKVKAVLVSEPIWRTDMQSARRKRLVVDPASGDLHVVVRENVHERQKVRFKVHKFNEQGQRWDVVENVGSERVLFVGIDHCFFAKAKCFPGCDGNSIVFASNCFTQYRGSDAPDWSLFDDEEVDLGLYRFGEGDNFSLLSSSNPRFAEIIWPPPTWFWNKRKYGKETEQGHASDRSSDEVGNSDDHAEGKLSGSSSGERASDDNHNDDVEIQLIRSDNGDRDDEKDKDNQNIDGEEKDDEEDDDMKSSNNSKRVHSCEDNKEAESSSSSEQQCTSDAKFSDQIGKNHYVAQGPTVTKHFTTPLRLKYEVRTMGTAKREYQTRGEGPDFLKEDAHASTTPVTHSVSSAHEKCSTVKFQEADVRTELLPTLQTIWAKHGNLVSEHSVRSKKMLACALEELAELVISLKNTTGKTLTDSLVDDMRSKLSDIQRAGLKVDWLAPVIDNAVAVQKSKPFIESIEALDKEIAKVEEKKTEFLAHTVKVKQELEESRAFFSARIPFPVDLIIDLDDCLGEGL